MDDQNINCLRADNRFGTEVFSPYTPPKSMKREGKGMKSSVESEERAICHEKYNKRGLLQNDLVCQQCFVWKKGLLHCVVATKVKVHKKREVHGRKVFGISTNSEKLLS